MKSIFILSELKSLYYIIYHFEYEGSAAPGGLVVATTDLAEGSVPVLWSFYLGTPNLSS